jgi:YkoP domain
VLIIAEWVDRTLRHITPIREGGVLAMELSRYHGAPVALRDGCRVEPGDPVVALHFRNDRVGEVVRPGWQRAGYLEGRTDLAALADWLEARPGAQRPVAVVGTTILGPLFARERWETRPVPRTWRTRLDAWWMRWLLAHFGRGGRTRVLRGHHELEVTQLWISASDLRARYGRSGLRTDSGGASVEAVGRRS